MVVDKTKLCHLCSNAIHEQGIVVGCAGKDVIGRVVKAECDGVIPIDYIEYCQFWGDVNE